MSGLEERVAGNFGRVFAMLLVLGLGAAFATYVLEGLLNVALPFVEPVAGFNRHVPALRVVDYMNYVIATLMLTLASCMGQAYTAVCTTLMYFDLRNRNQPFNIDALVAWSDRYRTWRDEPDVIAPAGNTGTPETGFKPSTGDVPKPGDQPPGS